MYIDVVVTSISFVSVKVFLLLIAFHFDSKSLCENQFHFWGKSTFSKIETIY